MATTDRLGATVDATDAPSSSTPNAGLAIKTAVRAATTGTNINLQTIGLGIIDGVQLVAGDRVLVKDQTDQTTNGIYNASSGVWAASSDFQSNNQIASGLQVHVNLGTANGNSNWALTTPNPITLGTSDLIFTSGLGLGLDPVLGDGVGDPGFTINGGATGTGNGGFYQLDLNGNFCVGLANASGLYGSSFDASSVLGYATKLTLSRGTPPTRKDVVTFTQSGGHDLVAITGSLSLTGEDATYGYSLQVGNQSGNQLVVINGVVGTAAGSSLTLDDNGSLSAAFGHYSSIFGGAGDATLAIAATIAARFMSTSHVEDWRWTVGGGISVGSTVNPGSGVLNANTGFRVGNAAASGNLLQGNGTNFVSSAAAFPTDAVAGQFIYASAAHTWVGSLVPILGAGAGTPSLTINGGGSGSGAGGFVQVDLGGSFNLGFGNASGLYGGSFSADTVFGFATDLYIASGVPPARTNVVHFNGANATFLGLLLGTTGVGYQAGAGAGGTVSQLTDKTTGVTLNKASGQITMNNASLGAGTIVSFVLTDSAIAATDVLVLNHISGGTPGSYGLNAQCAAGSATINVRNNTGGSLSEAIVLQFALIKGAIS